MIVSCASIPPRIRNKDIYKFIDSILNQTINVNMIYINLPHHFERFENLNKKEIHELENYNDKIKVTFSDLDSPLLKYTGALKYIDDDEIMFIGDDDQEYKDDLLENMLTGFYDDKAVYQNRYHVVKKGTAGIIHGFVGLMMKRKVFNNFNKFKIPKKCWIDDQLINIYFYKNNIRILPSPVHDFDDIYKTLRNGMEQIGSGALCMMDTPRKKQIRELEIFYNVFFLKKESNKSKGKLKDFDWNIFYKLKINIHYVIFDTITSANKKNFEQLMLMYPNFNYNIWDNTSLDKNIKLYNYHYLNYHSDTFARKKINEYDDELHIYINRNMEINKNFDIYEYLINDEIEFYNNENVLLIKNKLL